MRLGPFVFVWTRKSIGGQFGKEALHYPSGI